MSQLKIVHSTVYQYDGHATASYNHARMTPRTNADQIVLHSRLDVWPVPWTQSYLDYFGTQVVAFEVVDPHG
ncbi:MAG: transglutaminase N-terminal domain-containing protein, partial [Nocardioides sp.]